MLEAELLREDVVAPDPAGFVSYGGQVNVEAHACRGLINVGDRQIVVYYDQHNAAMLTRRHLLNPDAWEMVDLGHTLSEPDSHRTINAGVDGDGRIWVAMDCHASQATFAWTAPGAADSSAPLQFGPPSTTLGDLNLGPISYPSFVTRPDGKLQLFYREGGSNNGRWWLAEACGESWTVVQQITSSTGAYTVQWPNNGPWKTSNARAYYPHGWRYRGGMLHTLGCFREAQGVTSPAGLANRDLFHAVSPDFGRSWYTAAGQVLGAQITGANINARVIRVDPFYAYMNQEWFDVDSAGNPIGVISYVPGRFVGQWGGMVDDAEVRRPQFGRLFLVRRQPSGSWVNPEIKIGGLDLPLNAYGRAQAALLGNDDLMVVMAGGRIITATAVNGYTDWSMVYDPARYESLVAFGNGVLHVMSQANVGPLAIEEFGVLG